MVNTGHFAATEVLVDGSMDIHEKMCFAKIAMGRNRIASHGNINEPRCSQTRRVATDQPASVR